MLPWHSCIDGGENLAGIGLLNTVYPLKHAENFLQHNLKALLKTEIWKVGSILKTKTVPERLKYGGF